MAKEDIDWLAVENDYRPNILSLRAIGEKYGCTEGAVRKKAKKEGWVRDLSEKIKATADDLVRRELVRDSAQNETDVVYKNAITSAYIQITERNDIAKLRDIAMNLVDELESQSSYSGRVDCLKKLTEISKTLIDLERKVYKIDDTSSEDTGKRVNIKVNFLDA